MIDIKRTELVNVTIRATLEIEVPINTEAYPGCVTAAAAARYDIAAADDEGDWGMLLDMMEINEVTVDE